MSDALATGESATAASLRAQLAEMRYLRERALILARDTEDVSEIIGLAKVLIDSGRREEEILTGRRGFTIDIAHADIILTDIEAAAVARARDVTPVQDSTSGPVGAKGRAPRRRRHAGHTE